MAAQVPGRRRARGEPPGQDASRAEPCGYLGQPLGLVWIGGLDSDLNFWFLLFLKGKLPWNTFKPQIQTLFFWRVNGKLHRNTFKPTGVPKANVKAHLITWDFLLAVINPGFQTASLRVPIKGNHQKKELSRRGCCSLAVGKCGQGTPGVRLVEGPDGAHFAQAARFGARVVKKGGGRFPLFSPVQKGPPQIL